MLRATVVLYAMLLLTAPAAVRAEIINVDNENRLQRALNEAQDGDEVVLAPGFYPGRFQAFGLTGVTIRSADPSNPAVINAPGEGIKLSSAKRIMISDLIINGGGANGINIDDGGFREPSSDITIRNVTVQSGGGHGIKLTGVDNFLLDQVRVTEWGNNFAGINLLGSHDGVVQNSFLRHTQQSGGFGIKVEAGSANITIRANRFETTGERAIQFGGGVPEATFRPPPTGDTKVTASNIVAEGNVVVGVGRVGAIKSGVTFAGTDDGIFRNNVVFRPSRFLARVLKENRAPGFVDTQNALVKDNIFIWNQDDLDPPFAPDRYTGINEGPNTLLDTFQFEGNTWYNRTNPANSMPLPPEDDAIYGVDPNINVDQPISWEFDWGLWLVNATNQDFNVFIQEGLMLARPDEGGQLDVGSTNPLVGNWSLTPVQSNPVPIDALSDYVYVRGLFGDFDQSGAYDLADIALLVAELHVPQPDPAFDVDGNGSVDQDDLTRWVKDLRQTWLGDANLDGSFGSGDLVDVFVAGEYDDAIDGNSTWAEGDWNGDLDFDSGDLVDAFSDGGYRGQELAGAPAVPEPSTALLVLVSVVSLLARCRTGTPRQ